ncbi:MAG: hypothetical protein ACI37Q_01985 [Candidatus Gastranaerophilaceae bacterium]
MNILKINNLSYHPVFCAKQNNSQTPAPNSENLKPLNQDVVEIRTILPEIMPKKLELTEDEAIYDETWVKLKRLNLNILTQKEILRNFYSAQDKDDYKELLKERQRVLAKLRRIAKNCEFSEELLRFDISIKKEYNRYAPKVLNSTTLERLNEVEALINSINLYPRTLELLNMLINQQKKAIKALL